MKRGREKKQNKMKNNPMKHKISKRIVLPFIFLFVFVICGCVSYHSVSTKPPFSSVTLKAPITLKVTESMSMFFITSYTSSYLFPAGEYRVSFEERGGYYYCYRDKIQVTTKETFFGHTTKGISTNYCTPDRGGIFTKRGSTNPTALWLAAGRTFTSDPMRKYNFSETNVFELKP